MLLKNLLEKLEHQCIKGTTEIEITEVIYDSRKVSPGAVFVCIRGTQLDSHQFISDVIEKGAVAVIIEDNVEVKEDICLIKVSSSRKALAYLACAYFDHPASKLKMIGITGTKGKTTTSYMVQSILEKAGKKIGVIGTIGAVINGEHLKLHNTTPESFELQQLFKQMVEAGCEYCIMEVSSQGLKMDRVAGFTFDIGIFTNFSADHIGPGEHESMEEYLFCKSLLFRQCNVGFVNIDDPSYSGAIKDHTCSLQTFGFDHNADLKASQLKFIKEGGVLGTQFDLNGLLDTTITLSTPGKFSVYNSMVAIMIANHYNISVACMKEALMNIQVRGRVEFVPVADHFTILIDYAHNAASVENILSTLKAYNPNRIICVYGCGGNRSKLRRYDMGSLCGKMADLSILTTDNPRYEEVKDINEDIKTGLSLTNGTYIEIEDRTEAIHYSMDNAEEGDIIVLLGKGHENYQEVKGEHYYYNEREVIEEYRNHLLKRI